MARLFSQAGILTALKKKTPYKKLLTLIKKIQSFKSKPGYIYSGTSNFSSKEICIPYQKKAPKDDGKHTLDWRFGFFVPKLQNEKRKQMK